MHTAVAEGELEKGRHIHCFLELNRVFDTKNPRTLDLNVNTQKGDEKLHGNYQGAKHKDQVIQYILKDVLDKNNKKEVVMSENLHLYLDEDSTILLE